MTEREKLAEELRDKNFKYPFHFDHSIEIAEFILLRESTHREALKEAKEALLKYGRHLNDPDGGVCERLRLEFHPSERCTCGLEEISAGEVQMLDPKRVKDLEKLVREAQTLIYSVLVCEGEEAMKKADDWLSKAKKVMK